uniref:F5/8 type C domain-containing protein n=1 Tax=Magallana gigas TaxID=29159 RepID=K1RBM0_MAGGI
MSFDENNNDPWIYYEMRMTNVAAFKPVTMSSEHNPPSHSPHYAVDGQVKNTIYGKQCAHTSNDPNPWLTIDLENTFDVQYVTLFNRIETLGKEGNITLTDADYLKLVIMYLVQSHTCTVI